MFLNKAIICGNLTRDPEIRFIHDGSPVTSFSVATNRTWTDESGEKQQSVEFHNIVVFGNQAEPSATYLKKGQLVMVEGRLQTRSWDGQDGVKRYRTEIIADRVQFGPKRSSDPDEPASSPASTSLARRGKPRAEAEDNSEQIEDQDIPF